MILGARANFAKRSDCRRLADQRAVVLTLNPQGRLVEANDFAYRLAGMRCTLRIS